MSWVSVQGQGLWAGGEAPVEGPPGLEQHFLESLGSECPHCFPKKKSSQLSAQFLRELAGQEGKSLLGSIISMKTGRRV